MRNPYPPLFLRALCICAIVFLMIQKIAAQDVTLIGPFLFEMPDMPDTPPRFSGTALPKFPEEMLVANEPGYAIAFRANGSPGYFQIAGTNAACEESFREFPRPRKGPTGGRGRTNERQTKMFAWFAAIYNPASAASDVTNATVRLLKVAPVIVTAKQWSALPEMEKTLRGTIAIDASGIPQKITLDSKKAYAKAVLPNIQKSLEQWAFAPARKNGQPVASSIKTSFIMQIVPKSVDELGANRSQPVPLKRIQPVYPYQLKITRVQGEVVVEFLVNKQGNVEDPRVIRSTHKGFEDATIAAIKKWKYKPGSINDQPVPTRMRQVFAFSLNK